MAEPIRVLVVGPKATSADSRGGMATVVGLMQAQRDPRARLRTVATYVDGSRWARLRTGVVGMVTSTALVLSGRIDVLHVHLAHGGSVVRKAFPLLAARLTGTPAVVHAHSYDFAGWFDGLSARRQRAVRWALPARRWLVLGDDVARGYARRLQLPPTTVHVLRNPVELPGRVDREPGPRLRVLSLGRLGHRKGSYDLVQALALLPPDDRARLAVTIAGDGEVAEVRAAAERAGLQDVLDVRSWADPHERDALLAASEVFVLPSHEEGLPMALLEAMAWGLAPVVSPVGGIGDVVHDGVEGLLVPPGDPAAVAAALSTLVHDPQRRAAFACASRAVAADHAVELWFSDLVTLWTSLAPPPGLRPGGS